jgi:L-amino acid N-acyltransferase YncA
VGSKLLDAAIEASRALGYQRAQLWVVDENERATRLYSRRGFRHTGRVTSGDHGEPIGLWAADLG